MAAPPSPRAHRPLAAAATPMTVELEDLVTWMITAGLALVVIGFILGDLYGEHHGDHK